MFPSDVDYEYNRSIIDKYGIREEDILHDFAYNNIAFRTIQTDELLRQRNCYSIDPDDYVKKNMNRQEYASIEMYNIDIRLIGSIRIKFNPEETIWPSNPIGIVAAVHSKDDIINPFISGIPMTPGNRYIVQLTPILKTLLPSPFSTNCRNYINSSNNSFLFTRNYCFAECRKKLWLEKCGCLSPEYPFVTDEEICDISTYVYECLSSINLTLCLDKCRKRCK
ncbi:uncharacterized protein LOC111641737 [Centruroides sculpturatus]|uniref:uncharacterized protein LOC111641737 n=1 Tax=Centruroides sculpturatus TaxID=218467 RepID=UPI000C6D2AE3|nr:uncharacterized protein LOC111641737 [Centruroides sculpturatus]